MCTPQLAQIFSPAISFSAQMSLQDFYSNPDMRGAHTGTV
jgi:hypothetical protein